jgi:hypothetical protein
MHIYEVLPRKDRRGFDLISDVLPFGRLWYDGPVAFLCTTAAAEQPPVTGVNRWASNPF